MAILTEKNGIHSETLGLDEISKDKRANQFWVSSSHPEEMSIEACYTMKN